MKNNLLKISGLFCIAFGGVSVFMTLSVIFNLFGIREMEGNYVPFVVYANLICGIIYLWAGYGFFNRKNWTKIILAIAVVLLSLTFFGLLLHIYSGKMYEHKTVNAMIFRIIITLLLFYFSWRYISKKWKGEILS